MTPWKRWNPFPALAVALAVSLPTVITPVIIATTLWRLSGGGPKKRPLAWGLAATYLCYMIIDHRTPSRNPRTSSYARNFWIWPNGRKYFRASFNKHVQLRSDRTYLFAMHPHGIVCFSVWLNYVSNRNAFPELKSTRLATISSNFITPALRDVMMSLGFVPATKEALTYTLKHEQSTALLVGGASEAQANSNKAVRLVLCSRLGFVRVAMEADSPAVIIFHLHENNTFQSPLAKSTMDCEQKEKKSLFIKSILGFQEFFLKTFSFSIPVFFGRCTMFYPHRPRLETVTGDFPIDFRVLAEFYYFLVFNQLPTGAVPQCPLGAANVPHKHISGALDRCYCAMYSTLGADITMVPTPGPTSPAIGDQSLNPTLDPTTTSTLQIGDQSLTITKSVAVNRPKPLTMAEIYNDATFPVEYQLQQAEVGDYESILSQLPNSRKKKVLLGKIAAYKAQQEAKLVQFAEKYDEVNGTNSAAKVVDYSNSIGGQGKASSSSSPSPTQPTDPRLVKYFQPSLSSHDPQSVEPYQLPPSPQQPIPPQIKPGFVINKPCFLEEILHIPIISPEQRFALVSHTNDIINSTTTFTTVTSSQLIPTLSPSSYQSHTVNWGTIPDPVVKWLLLLYIAQLHQTYHKYNDDNEMPLELADFDLIKFCINDCGILLTTPEEKASIPQSLTKKYLYGADINDYLVLMGWNGGLVMGLLAAFLNLKQPSTPLSLDGTSGKPYKHQPEPSPTQTTAIMALSTQAEVVVGDGKVAKL